MNIPKPVAMAILFAVLSLFKPSKVVTLDIGLPDWIANVIQIGEPSPFSDSDFHAVIFEESADRSSLKPEQLEAILSTADGSVRDYCVKHAVQVNGVPDFRVLDKDTDLSKDTAGVQAAGKVPRKSVPWLVVGKGRKWKSVPLPETKAEQLAILTSIGGK